MKKLLLFVITFILFVSGMAFAAQEDSIIRMTEDWPTYIDPAVGSSFSDCIAIVNLYDSLVFPNMDGTVSPSLAKSWDISDDGLVYTFHLRENVSFHSGNEVTAEDVVFSANRLLTIGEGFGYLFDPVIENVKAMDKYTVEFKLKKPFGPFILSLVRLYIVEENLVMKHIEKPGPYDDKGDYGKQWLLTHDAGSGPYRVKEVKMAEHVHGERFDDWWGGWEENAPQYFKLMGTVEPVTVRTLVSNQELEITDELQPLENYQIMDKMDGVDVISYLNGGNLNIMLHTQKPPTDDVHFRKALAYLMDSETVCKSIFPGSVPATSSIPKTLPGYADVSPYEYNLEKAREELAKSKYADKLSQYPIDLSWCAEVPSEKKVALLFQANCSKLGIKVNVTKKPFGSMIADAQTKETTPHGSVVFVSPHYAEAGSMLTTRYHSSSCGTWEQCEWLENDEIDRMIDDALATIDMEKRFDKYAKIQKKIADLCPTIWIMDRAETRAYQESYVEWPPVKLAKAGKNWVSIMGYEQYVHDMKVYPDKK